MDGDWAQFRRTVPQSWSKKKAPRGIGIHYQILKYAHNFSQLYLIQKHIQDSGYAHSGFWLLVDNRAHIVLIEAFSSQCHATLKVSFADHVFLPMLNATPYFHI